MNEWIERRSDNITEPASQPSPVRGFNSTSVDSQFQRDRARIIHSASFRALQSKTQVLGLGESDFYRTRLTHSLEVAQIGSGVCEWLRNGPFDASRSATTTTVTDAFVAPTPPDSKELLDWIPSMSLIEAICLAHDIGHSPYGHGGEVALNYLMKDKGGFEANGQTLRILSRLGEYSPQDGLDLTRRTQLGTIKYPVFYTDVAQYTVAESLQNEPAAEHPPERKVHRNIDHWAPPKCLYDSDRQTLEWILSPFNEADKQRFLSIQHSTDRHARAQFKSLDTSIMELSDDIAYGVHDLEDALALNLVDFRRWEDTVVRAISQLQGNAIANDMDFYNQQLFSNDNRNRKHAISKLVGYFIRNISVTELSEFTHPLLRYQAVMETHAYRILQCLKQFVMDEVIMRPELQTLQYKGQQVIINLFEIFAANPKRLLPRDVYRAYTGEESDEPAEDYRAIADFISAMTDVSAGKLYHKLLMPTSGSIFDRT